MPLVMFYQPVEKIFVPLKSKCIFHAATTPLPPFPVSWRQAVDLSRCVSDDEICRRSVAVIRFISGN